MRSPSVGAINFGGGTGIGVGVGVKVSVARAARLFCVTVRVGVDENVGEAVGGGGGELAIVVVGGMGVRVGGRGVAVMMTVMGARVARGVGLAPSATPRKGLNPVSAEPIPFAPNVKKNAASANSPTTAKTTTCQRFQ